MMYYKDRKSTKLGGIGEEVVKTIKLTDTEISCIYNLVRDRQIEGSYSGNKEQYYKRIESILRKLECACNEEKKCLMTL